MTAKKRPAGVGQEIKISFTATIVPKKEAPQAATLTAAPIRDGVFSIEEIEIGGEQFVTVLARTRVEIE
ncbi:MAG TPA: hypothetical protein VLH09_06870 [Bryobacteraceae bacterium]|nr:hypothetical protein [Bryobacteraceae bacterium]